MKRRGVHRNFQRVFARQSTHSLSYSGRTISEKNPHGWWMKPGASISLSVENARNCLSIIRKKQGWNLSNRLGGAYLFTMGAEMK